MPPDRSDPIPPASFRDREGHELVLFPEPIARGGEGSIHRLRGVPGIVAKLYFEAPDASRTEKIAAMIARDSEALREAAAWPTGLVVEGSGSRGRAVGFLMPEVVGHREIHQLFSPVERKRHFPDANWKMLALTASNLARVVDAVHQAGCVIGDLNQNNVLVTTRATVRLIDCDSFQFRQDEAHLWTCDVGKEEYLPAELQSSMLRGVVREPGHDAFALAVLAFQLLFMGRHPFSGRHTRDDDFGIGQAIAERAYFYGRQAARRALAPPPGVITPGEVSAEIADAFERAFVSDRRPSAAEWADSLLRFAHELVVCDRSPRHLYHPASNQCPWCALKKTFRVDFFPDAVRSETDRVGESHRVDFGIDPDALLARIQAVPDFRRTYRRPVIPKSRLRPPLPPPSDLRRPQKPEIEPEPGEPTSAGDDAVLILVSAFAWPILAAAVALTLTGVSLAVPAFVVAGVLFLLRFVVARLIFRKKRAAWAEECEAVRASNEASLSAWNEIHAEWLMELDRRRRRRDEILSRLLDRETAWTSWLESLRQQDATLRVEATELHVRLKDRITKFEESLKSQSASMKTEAVEKWLESHLIRNADIAQIGRTRVAVLASFGIETAADVVRLVQAQSFFVPGFGPKLMNNLWYWAAGIQSRFAPSMVPQVSREISAKIRSQFEPEIRSIAHRLERIAEERAALIPAVDARAPKVLRYLEEVTRLLTEAEADLRVME